MLGPKRRRIPVVPILGGVVLVAVAAIAVVWFTGRPQKTAPPAARVATEEPPQEDPRKKARADSIAKAQADSIATYAPTPTVGWVRVIGELPEEAVIWLDQRQMQGRIFPSDSGRHHLEVETQDFQPWERWIRVFVGDTVRVRVALILQRPGDSTP